MVHWLLWVRWCVRRGAGPEWEYRRKVVPWTETSHAPMGLQF